MSSCVWRPHAPVSSRRDHPPRRVKRWIASAGSRASPLMPTRIWKRTIRMTASPQHRSPLTDVAREVKKVFREIGFTTPGIADLLGPDYTQAMHAGQPAAVRYHLDTLPETDLILALRALVLRDEVRVDKLASLFGERTVATLI